MKIKETEIKIVKGDITELKVDAIVNAANNKLVMGGGVAGAIKKKGGKLIEEEAMKKGPIRIGQAIFTSGGNLPAKYVIHAATMGMDFATDELKIRDSCKNSLKVAEELNINSIAFPALGCGVGGFPLLASAKLMAQEVLKHLREKKSSLKEIIFCLFDLEAYEVFNKGVSGYLEYVTQKLEAGPFSTVDAIIEVPVSPACGPLSPACGPLSPKGSAGYQQGRDEGIVIIKRSNPPFGWALPGGFVDYGESLEDAIKREAKEETSLELTDIKQFHTYSDPSRDPRFHTIGTVFIARAKGKPRAGDDAAELKVVKLSEIEKLEFAFDHKKIIQDYINYKNKQK